MSLGASAEAVAHRVLHVAMECEADPDYESQPLVWCRSACPFP